MAAVFGMALFGALLIGCSENNPPDSDGDGVVNDMDVDDDNDGLIEINFLEDLDFVRNDLAGHSYDTTAGGAAGVTAGAPAAMSGTVCDEEAADGVWLCGYELARTLNFSVAIDYRSGTVNMVWTDDAGPDTGWIPIGNNKGANEAEQDLNRFNAIFDGNGNTITGLTINRDGTDNTITDGTSIANNNIGLFGYIGATGAVRRLNLSNAQVRYTGTRSSRIGPLAGQSVGTIIAVSATGGATTGGGVFDIIGGLVGNHLGLGAIVVSYATGAVIRRRRRRHYRRTCGAKRCHDRGQLCHRRGRWRRRQRQCRRACGE